MASVSRLPPEVQEINHLFKDADLSEGVFGEIVAKLIEHPQSNALFYAATYTHSLTTREICVHVALAVILRGSADRFLAADGCTMYQLLDCFIAWNRSPQGHYFWKYICREL